MAIVVQVLVLRMTSAGLTVDLQGEGLGGVPRMGWVGGFAKGIDKMLRFNETLATNCERTLAYQT